MQATLVPRAGGEGLPRRALGRLPIEDSETRRSLPQAGKDAGLPAARKKGRRSLRVAERRGLLPRRARRSLIRLGERAPWKRPGVRVPAVPQGDGRHADGRPPRRGVLYRFVESRVDGVEGLLRRRRLLTRRRLPAEQPAGGRRPARDAEGPGALPRALFIKDDEASPGREVALRRPLGNPATGTPSNLKMLSRTRGPGSSTTSGACSTRRRRRGTSTSHQLEAGPARGGVPAGRAHPLLTTTLLMWKSGGR